MKKFLTLSMFVLGFNVSAFTEVLQCEESGERVNVTFKTSSESKFSDRVQGHVVKGSHSGDVEEKFYGVSAFNDVMVVERVRDNDGKTFFNINISLCPKSMKFGDSSIGLISTDREINQFYIPTGIVLSSESNSTCGSIDIASNTMAISESQQVNAEGFEGILNDFEIYTTFYKGTDHTVCGDGEKIIHSNSVNQNVHELVQAEKTSKKKTSQGVTK